ncbi:MAG: GNAT family N-acetyltransferase [Verrucomicrobiales bacterium]|nr:GNAT family N-acetyltransferase [Verrucomicrobiales bacterium]
MTGRFCHLQPLDPNRHGTDLHSVLCADSDPRIWTYLPYGPFATSDEFSHWLQIQAKAEDPQFYAILDPSTQRAVGLASYLRITPAAGSIEVGHLLFSPTLRRTPAATEAMYLMMARAFRLGYRRYEWKCDAWNEPSRAAARRLGFAFEGLFRQAIVYKGRSRDTAWYSVIDRDWPELEAVFRKWLDPSNFDEHQRQRARLSAGTESLRLRDASLPEEPRPVA